MNAILIDRLCRLYDIRQIKGSRIPILKNYKFVDRLGTDSCYIMSACKHIDIEVADSLQSGMYLCFSSFVTRCSQTLAMIPPGSFNNKNEMYLLAFVKQHKLIDSHALEYILNCSSKKNIKVKKNALLAKKPPKHSCVQHVYTDASIIKKQAAIGIWNDTMQKHYRFKIHEHHDINLVELTAILCSLLLSNAEDLVVFTDSQVSISLINGEIHSKKYSDIVDCIKTASKKFRSLKIKKIAAHSGVIGNEIADYLARTSIKENKASEVLLHPELRVIDELGLVFRHDVHEYLRDNASHDL